MWNLYLPLSLLALKSIFCLIFSDVIDTEYSSDANVPPDLYFNCLPSLYTFKWAYVFSVDTTPLTISSSATIDSGSK